MSENNFYIQIIKCSNDLSWYKDHIGEIFIVRSYSARGEQLYITENKFNESHGKTDKRIYLVNSKDIKRINLRSLKLNKICGNIQK